MRHTEVQSNVYDSNIICFCLSIQVPCEENNFTKSADMEKRSLPDDVQHSLDAFQDLHPRNSS